MNYENMCPKYEAAIEIIGKKWTGLIIRVLLSGPKRFKDIKKQIPDMSDRMLTERMKELESVGIVKREVYPETPVRIEYQLTDKGISLKDVIGEIQRWSDHWINAENKRK
ncbi:helix-turn-helix domain-containing protein [Alkalihalobacillus sp. AL-G]|uniref:winged helix-turn-helix transcriptional regulator n=1 Tax=Alkalihalobacillus sp. AL-G TaxID=2926399 RepID=UPI00272B2ABA|nr:helix-turn-helix domain-containing protein [Alkalihalobacillus sp. AL-G]WLD93961.1 helix-turn-helix transcriptional regulator [Alkalihalobacillus sp. AL-G]